MPSETSIFSFTSFYLIFNCNLFQLFLASLLAFSPGYFFIRLCVNKPHPICRTWPGDNFLMPPVHLASKSDNREFLYVAKHVQFKLLLINVVFVYLTCEFKPTNTRCLGLHPGEARLVNRNDVQIKVHPDIPRLSAASKGALVFPSNAIAGFAASMERGWYRCRRGRIYQLRRGIPYGFKEVSSVALINNLGIFEANLDGPAWFNCQQPNL